MNKKIILSLILFLGILAIIPLAQAGTNTSDANIFNTTTEINSATPSLSLNVTGNCSNYNVNVTMGGTVVVDSQVITNATTTAFTTSSLTARTTYLTNATFWNTSCDDGANVTSNVIFYINGRPVVDSVSANLEQVGKGETITWTVPWTDVNTTGTTNDTVSIYFCKSNAFASGSCTGGQWSNSTPETEGKGTVPFKVSDSDSAGDNSFFVFLRDNNNYDVASPTSGSFTIRGGGSASGTGTSVTTVTVTPTTTAVGVPSAELTVGERVQAFFQDVRAFFSRIWVRLTT